MVDGGQVGIDAPWLASRQAQAFERLRRGHFVNDLPVDVNQRRAVVALLHQVRVEQLVIEGLACHCSIRLCQGWRLEQPPIAEGDTLAPCHP
jgi:hypothetical protein